MLESPFTIAGNGERLSAVWVFEKVLPSLIPHVK